MPFPWIFFLDLIRIDNDESNKNFNDNLVVPSFFSFVVVGSPQQNFMQITAILWMMIMMMMIMIYVCCSLGDLCFKLIFLIILFKTFHSLSLFSINECTDPVFDHKKQISVRLDNEIKNES